MAKIALFFGQFVVAVVVAIVVFAVVRRKIVVFVKNNKIYGTGSCPCPPQG